MKVLKTFQWAHQGIHVKEYVEGSEIESDDEELIEVATREGWIGEEADKPKRGRKPKAE